MDPADKPRDVGDAGDQMSTAPNLHNDILHHTDIRAKSYFAHFVTKDDLMSKIVRPHGLL